jgi:hypothetical protein
MRRYLLCGCVCLLALASCARKGDLPPDEVLRQAALASANLQSARFTLSADISAQGKLPVNGKLTLGGVLQQGGKNVQTQVSVDATVGSSDARTRVQAQAEVVNEEKQDLYFNVHSLTVEPDSSALNTAALQPFIGHWWKIPQAASSAVNITSDPRFLRAQAEVVTVTADRGLTRINGHDAYLYDVTIDPVKLLSLMRASSEAQGRTFDEQGIRAQLAQYAAAGQLWIDARTFYVQRIRWTITSVPGAASPLTAHLSADLRDHDAAPAVQVPVDAMVFPRGSALQQVLGGSGSAAVAPQTQSSEEGFFDQMFREQVPSDTSGDTSSFSGYTP